MDDLEEFFRRRELASQGIVPYHPPMGGTADLQQGAHNNKHHPLQPQVDRGRLASMNEAEVQSMNWHISTSQKEPLEDPSKPC